jgi:restriction endonuclease Mrr
MNSKRGAVPSESDYNGIIRANLEVEDRSERSVAELAFVIFLLQKNYYLSPADYQRLLDSSTRTTGDNGWQTAFHQIAQEHVHTFVSRSGDLPEN